MTNLNNEIKMLLLQKNMTLTDLINDLNTKFNREDSVQNLSNKLRRETLKYVEAKEIAEVLGFELRWEEKKD